MKGVILAAGEGGRLRPLTLDRPKVLLDIAGHPLIHYPLEAFGAAGVLEIAVVVGYQSDKVLEALLESHPNVTFIHNDYSGGGNAHSLYAARSFVEGDPFVVCMGDHPISSQIVQRLLSGCWDGCVLCIDRAAWLSSQQNDATRVELDSCDHVAAIGKALEVWNAVDTGVFRMTQDVFPVIERLMEAQGPMVTITDLVISMAGRGEPFATCDVTGLFWADVDTPEDYLSVDSLLREKSWRACTTGLYPAISTDVSPAPSHAS